MITLKSMSSIGCGLCILAMAAGCGVANAAGGSASPSPAPTSSAPSGAPTAGATPTNAAVAKVKHCIPREALCLDVPSGWNISAQEGMGGGIATTISKDHQIITIMTGKELKTFNCPKESERTIDVLRQTPLNLKKTTDEKVRSVEYVLKGKVDFEGRFASLGDLGAAIKLGKQQACDLPLFVARHADGSKSLTSIEFRTGYFPTEAEARQSLESPIAREAREMFASIRSS